MLPNDATIERWLREVSSDEDDLPDDEGSDLELDLEPPNLQEESCESDSAIEGNEESDLEPENASALPQNAFTVTPAVQQDHEEQYSSDDEVPLLQRRSRPRPAVQQDHEEQFSSDDEVPLLQRRSRPRKKNYFGKNRFRWASEPPSLRSRTLQHNIVNEAQGIKPAYRDVLTSTSTPLEIWQQFFTDEMLQQIVLHTNIRIWQIRPNYKNQTCVSDLDLIELKAFIGFLFFTAIFKENRTHYASYYCKDGSGREIYRCIMSKNRLEVLLKTIRFDDAETRAARRENDASAPISQLFDSLIERFQAVYSIGSSACIDEMLLAFRGRCRFKMYMPKKPAKYGIKILCLTDARSGYLLKAYIYLGKDSDGLNLPAEYQRQKKPTQAVMRLISPIEGSNRNITTDNWFTSVELIHLLKEKQLTLVGTLRKNVREIPPEFLPSKHRNVDSTLFGFTTDMTISSYVPKKNKAVVTISSMHHTPTIDEATNKPEIIMYYNQTKFGVDVLDQRCSNYSTGRRTRRWPLAVFYRLLDISASNSYIINVSTRTTKPETRFRFMKTLAEQLVRPHLERRSKNLHLTRDLLININNILNKDKDLPAPQPGPSNVEERLQVRKCCSTCDPKKQRKTQYICIECKKPICIQCSNKLCIGCRETWL